MDKDIERRWKEIECIHFIQSLYSRCNGQYNVVMSLLENIATLCGQTTLQLYPIINIISTQDRRYMPSKNEMILLCLKSNIPVRDVCKITNISMRDYYGYKSGKLVCEANIKPRFDEASINTVCIMMDYVYSLLLFRR